MKAVIVPSAGAPFELVDRPMPEPGPGAVRVAVEACGICHSDLFVKEGGRIPVAYPRVPGHEVAGRVDAVGAGVANWKPGDRVGVGWFGGSCGRCERCRAGDFINCANLKICGIHYDGGYAEYMVAPEDALARIPEDLSAVEAAPLLCAGITTYNALRHSGARPGDVVAILGIGGLGHLGVQFAARMGFHTVALSRGTGKETLARQLGAHVYIDTDTKDAVAALQSLGGASVILATAPNAALIARWIDGLTRRGRMVIVAAEAQPIQVSPLALISGRSVAGWPSGASLDSEATMRFAAVTGVRPRIEEFPLERAGEAYARMMKNDVRFRAVLRVR
ncbi:MAG: alcohol dehydrogenase catalytic domain-containing protein [Myxococcales bacterium]|nr:alcohol dehydrogenase catalytic domain-containing protein [Myxococcales bacterium]